jgi:hypothetical protein
VQLSDSLTEHIYGLGAAPTHNVEVEQGKQRREERVVGGACER